jgi:hypothetical protein
MIPTFISGGKGLCITMKAATKGKITICANNPMAKLFG